MKIITGYTGTPHINSDDMAAFQQGVVGINDYVLFNGSDFTATAITGSNITLSKAEVVIQGTHCRVEGNEEVNIEVGTQGLYRNDLIIAKYEKASGTDIESVSIDIKKGTAVANDVVDPELTQNDIRNGGQVREVALFRVELYGSVIQKITRVIPLVDNMYLLQTHLNTNTSAIDTLKDIVKNAVTDIKTAMTNITNLQNKLDFSGTIRSVSQYAKCAIRSWVSAYNTSGKPSILGTGFGCQNASGTMLSELRLYSDGRLTLYKGETAHSMWVIKKGIIKINPTKADSNKQGTIKYGVTFHEAPTVVLTPITENPKAVNVSVSDVGTSSCHANLMRSSTTETTIQWVAIGKLG